MMTLGSNRRMFAVLVALGLVLGACGGGGGGDNANPLAGAGDANDAAEGEAPEPEFDGCELVTAEDAEEILGEPVEVEATDVTGLQIAGCVYGTAREESPNLIQFQMYRGEQFYGEEQFKEGKGFEKVDGIGDRAFFMDLGGPTLQLLDGDIFISLSANLFPIGALPDPPDEAEVKEQLKALALEVLARL